jgi:hypothetical protein
MPDLHRGFGLIFILVWFYQAVTPVKTGVQKKAIFLDSGFRRNDKIGLFHTWCVPINL